MRDGCDGPTMGRGRVPYPLKDEPIEAPKRKEGGQERGALHALLPLVNQQEGRVGGMGGDGVGADGIF